MRWVLGLCLAACLGFAPLGRAATAGPETALLFQPFDAGALDPAETRLLQAALAASGDYEGRLDGRWGEAGAGALAAWSAREFGGPALNAYAAAAVTGFLDAAKADGWGEVWLADLGLAIALPLDRLAAPRAEGNGERRWTSDGSFTVLTQRLDRADALAWHAAAEAAAVDPETSRSPERLMTAGVLRDGRVFQTQSVLVAGGWATVYLAADPRSEGALRLAAGSVHPGRPEPFEAPSGGRLAGMLAATAALLDAARAEPARAPAAGTPTPLPASYTDSIVATSPTPEPATGGAEGATGTGFYLGPRLILTADHVIEGCGRASLADGTPLDVVAQDALLDIAVLRAPRPARRWLSLADHQLRLGQRVHALGFPYYSIAGTSLNLTSGNVSALAGIDDDRHFFSFTAPVQPGNSGGPLLDARGGVLGLVVARLSEDYIVEATGSLPQNVNYALREDEIAGFLAARGIDPGREGDGFVVDEGVPDGVDAAIVPVVCG